MPADGNNGEEMSFDDAFTEATNAEAAPATPAEPVVEPAAEPVVVVEGGEPAAEPVVAAPEPSAESSAEPPAEPIVAAPAEPSEPATALSGDDAAELARLRAAEAEWKKQQTEPPAEPPAAEQPPAAEAKPVLTEAERARIEEYKADWPDVATAEELLRKEMGENLKTEVYTAVGQVLQSLFGMIQPLLNEHKDTSATKRDTAITAKVVDYPQIKAAMTAWMNNQPAPVAKAYQETLDTGSIDDVIKVVSLYKQAVGKTTPQTTSSTAPPAAPALEPVSGGRRTAPVATESNPNDFAAAWDEAVKNIH